MPVAKSYQALKQLSKPFEQNGRMYITVQMKSGKSKDIRWYNEQEYAKMYPDAVIAIDKTKNIYYKSQKDVLGFDKGYITIFKGVKEEHEEWFKQSICRYARWWGWYVISTEEVSKDLPKGVEPVRLNWEPMGNSEDKLVDEETVHAHVIATLYPKTFESIKQGEIGDRLERQLTIEEVITTENFYGKVHTHIMRDENQNLYIWKTSSKYWANGTVHNIRGTVKEFDTYKGTIATVLTRCMEK